MAWQFRKAMAGDIPAILKIMDDARRAMAASGNFQWSAGYPAREDIEADIADGVGHVALEREFPIAYGAIGYDGEPAYDRIDGQWLSDRPYAVLHRLAVAASARGKGLGRKFLDHAERHALAHGVKSIKVDTSMDNAAMRHILTEHGFACCGFVRFRDIRLLAFEKLLGD